VDKYSFEQKLNIKFSLSTVSTEPVSSDLVSLESLSSELLVASVLDGVHLESVRVGVDVMELGEQVGDGVHEAGNSEDHGALNLLIGTLGVSNVGDVLGDIMGHLGGGGGSSVVVLNHTVMELGGHGDNHVIVVGVEVTTLRDIKSERRGVMVTSEQVVGVVGKTGTHLTNLGKFWRPDTQVSSLGFMDSLVWGVDSVMDDTLSVIPFLEEITSVLLMSRVHSGQELHGLAKLGLLETLVHEQVVLLMHGSMTSLARSGENLETASQSGGVVGVPCDGCGPVRVTVVHTNGVNLFFVTLDTVRGTNVISEDPSLTDFAIE